MLTYIIIHLVYIFYIAKFIARPVTIAPFDALYIPLPILSNDCENAKLNIKSN
jgi:hypothetical protein